MDTEYVLDVIGAPSPFLLLPFTEEDKDPAPELIEFVIDYSGCVNRSFKGRRNLTNSLECQGICPASQLYQLFHFVDELKRFLWIHGNVPLVCTITLPNCLKMNTLSPLKVQPLQLVSPDRAGPIKEAERFIASYFPASQIYTVAGCPGMRADPVARTCDSLRHVNSTGRGACVSRTVLQAVHSC